MFNVYQTLRQQWFKRQTWQNHAWTSFWSIGEYLAYPLMMLAATPLFIRGLGVDGYGQWILMMTLTTLGGVMNLGMPAAVIKEVSAARGLGDHEGVSHAISACLAVTLLATVLATLSLLLIWSLLDGSLFEKIGNSEQINLLFFTSATLIIIEQIDSVVSSSIRGLEKFKLIAQIEFISKLSLVIFCLIAIYITPELKNLFLTIIVLTALRLLSKIITLKIFLGNTPWPKWHYSVIKSSYDFGKWSWLQQIGAGIFVIADRVILANFVGAGALAIYWVCLQISQQIQAIPRAGAQFIFPLTSRSMSTGADFNKLAKQAFYVTAIFAGSTSALAYTLGDQFLTILLGSVAAREAAQTLTILALAYSLMAISVVPQFILLGAGESKFVGVLNTIAGLSSAGFSFFLIQKFGLDGAAYSKIICAVIMSVFLYKMVSFFRSSPHDI